MKTVRVGNGRLAEVPETWAEAEKMITKGMRFHEGRGRNGNLNSIAARIAYGLLCEREVTADPTDALAFLMLKICQRKGAGLV